MYYYKAQPRDYRQAEDAEDVLLERIKASFEALTVMGKDPYRMSIGFADESAAQLHSNNARLWSLHPHVVRKVCTNPKAVKFFGYYALQGNSILEEMKNCKSEDFKPLLRKVQEMNADKEGVILFWDNAKAHKQVEAYAWKLGIYIIPLPPYSPNLNPIERVWKSCKKWIYQQSSVKRAEDLTQNFQKAFNLFKMQTSFTKGWRKKTTEIINWNNPVFNLNSR